MNKGILIVPAKVCFISLLWNFIVSVEDIHFCLLVTSVALVPVVSGRLCLEKNL